MHPRSSKLLGNLIICYVPNRLETEVEVNSVNTMSLSDIDLSLRIRIP